VLPSLYEGFGLPCLEAMACGVPVVASNAAALPETCGDAALLVDPHDASGFADALLRIATDEELRARLSAASLARAEPFTWARTAKETDAALERLL
jgi:alpha-1,3-rhamnosyl/mannosyltransferase